MDKISIQYNKKRFSKAENELIARAYEFAAQAHAGQMRASGDPYLIHPVAVAELVASWGLDAQAVAAALLHDVVEDTPTGANEIAKLFGDKVAQLVQGLTKLRLSTSPRMSVDSARIELNSENLRRLLLASSKDLRVILIKLADRLHNMRTLEALPDEKRERIAWESLQIFAPLADRLGMGQLKGEMEDLGFAHAKPAEYEELRRQVDEVMRNAQVYLDSFKRAIARRLRAGGVRILSIEARQKHYYSIYKKLAKVDGDVEKIYDLVAVRVIVEDTPMCYQALGILHQHYKPLIYRIKDYIAVPKPNGYQSLHTTVFGDEGRITEIQIRTPEMHEAAEHGLAAHFYYDAQKSAAGYTKRVGARRLPKKLGWVNELAQLQQSAKTGQEFLESAKLELFADRIFVFSPKGDLYELPEGSTPLDFAFAVHSNLGLRALGAKVNGRLVPLDTRLDNRDVVEIVTRREAAPSRDWLGLVVTSHAKSRIRAWFRAASREANVASGRALVENELPTWGVRRLEDIPKRTVAEAIDALHVKSLDDVLALVGEGAMTVMTVIRKLVPDAAKPRNVAVVKRAEPTGRILVEGERLHYTVAACCNPVYPEPLLGYVTRGKGITVHALGCRNIPVDVERYASCRWETADGGTLLACKLRLTSLNRIGLLFDITAVLAEMHLNLSQISSRSDLPGDMVEIAFMVEVPDLFVLAKLRRKLSAVAGVETVVRDS